MLLLTSWSRRLAAASLVVSAVTAPAAALDDPLTLRVNDGRVRPGGTVVLLVRTYAPRPLSRGQLCFRASSTSAAPLVGRGTASQPFFDIVNFVVLSGAGDAAVAQPELLPDPTGQTVLLDFESPSATVNVADGPLAYIELSLAPGVQVGERFELSLDAAATTLVDAHDNPVPIEHRPGELVIVAPDAPYQLQVEDSMVMAGGTAYLWVDTLESLKLADAHIVLSYDPILEAGTPTASVHPLHGSVLVYDPPPSVPGLFVVDVVSEDLQYNHIPGVILEVRLPVPSGLTQDASFEISLHPDTVLTKPDFSQPVLSLESGWLTVRPDMVFLDDFESGGVTAWQ